MSLLIVTKPNKPIPRIVHQIWLGPHQRPQTWMDSWRDGFCAKHNWEYKLWTDKEVSDFTLANQQAYDDSIPYQQKSDIARYEIMYMYGGLYIDCDMIYLGNNLEDFLPFHTSDFIAVNESPSTLKIGPPYCSNGFFAVTPKHPAIKKMVDMVSERVYSNILKKQPVWVKTGPVLFNACIQSPIVLIKHDWIFPLNFHMKTNVDNPMIFKETALVFTYNGQEYPHMKCR